MENLQQTPNLTKAVIKVMTAVKNIDKTLTVGTGSSSYKGIADTEVKLAINEAMAENGLIILPIDIEPMVRLDRWEEEDSYSKSTPKAKKTKQSVFTEVKTKYLLMHESGESIVLAGYGHGIDSQDKSAGKATTYALKNTLLYTFLIATTKLEDSDNTHSDDLATPKTVQQAQQRPKPNLTPGTAQWNDAVTYIKGKGTIAKIKEKYSLSKVNEELLLNSQNEIN